MSPSLVLVLRYVVKDALVLTSVLPRSYLHHSDAQESGSQVTAVGYVTTLGEKVAGVLALVNGS